MIVKVRFEALLPCVVWCKPPAGNPHGYGASSLYRARQKQRKERDSGIERGEISVVTDAVNFALTAKSRQYWGFAGTKKPGACPGFEMVVETGRIELPTF